MLSCFIALLPYKKGRWNCCSIGISVVFIYAFYVFFFKPIVKHILLRRLNNTQIYVKLVFYNLKQDPLPMP